MVLERKSLSLVVGFVQHHLEEWIWCWFLFLLLLALYWRQVFEFLDPDLLVSLVIQGFILGIQ